jgi:pimeloyl-ACP methyl ester carboxylesterase
MNHPVAAQLFLVFMKRGFSVLRFNFRGVGRSQGEFDAGLGELADAATAVDWLQANNATASQTWVAGFDFGAYIGMQLLMRRPEVDGFISVSPPHQRLRFQLPRALPLVRPDRPRRRRRGHPRAGGGAHRRQDPHAEGHHRRAPDRRGAGAFWDGHLPELETRAGAYVDRRMAEGPAPKPQGRRLSQIGAREAAFTATRAGPPLRA